MLNMNNERELAYVVQVDKIEPIVGSDNCEAAVIGGWRIMVRNGIFHPGDLAIYFEIDSQVPATETFAFLEKKNYKIKTQRYTFGGKGLMISQGLLMHPNDFGWTTGEQYDQDGFEHKCIIDVEHNNELHFAEGETRFLTKKLGVTYAVAEDNARKANSADKYKKMAQRNGKLFSKKPFRWLMRREWGRKLLFVFFGKQKDKKSGWPAWVAKTDEERVQNMPWILNDTNYWIATEKIDGTSTTFTMKRGKKHPFGRDKNEFYVCSRNVVFDKPDKNCFYETNVYTEMAEKYGVEKILQSMMDDHPEWDWVTLQGETFGAGIQRRDYSMKDHDFMGFNLIDSVNGRWNSIHAAEYMKDFGIKWVPIVDTKFILPDTVDELLAIATDKSVVDGKEREGLVFRSEDGARSFKAVSNEFLMKYHG